ncbi:unnamed protein product [Parnassius apollo]|uniref:Lipase n=1 Tax=Parnassius apollo TaxID=110799 RepID=A0A8S3XCW0_PARAO|nr:unnamed protein product [Parnassius apollo]
MFSKEYLYILLFLILLQNLFRNEKPQTARELKLQQGYPLDSLLNFTELATKYGYVSEQHTVVTADDYILTMFRITRGKNCHGTIRKPPVLLLHGLLMSSDSWIDAGPKAGLAYLISDLCYDLWVPNIRGNYYSKKHNKLDPEKHHEYWDFSIIEIAYYDIPALIDYVLNYTMSEKINYVGYSQGGSTFLIMNSERTEYHDKIGVGILLEPGSRQIYTKSQLCRQFAYAYQTNLPYLYKIGIYEALPIGGIVQKVAAFLCKNYIIADTVCRNFLSIIDSFHPGSVETETIRVLMGHFPAGTSVKNMAWYGQAMNVDVFQKFDYGPSKNLQMYGTAEPPPFNLSAVTVPVVVIHGRNDFLTSPADIDWLTSHLPNVLEDYYVVDPLWNHFDVTYSQFTAKSILPKIKEYLEKYSQNREM